LLKKDVAWTWNEKAHVATTLPIATLMTSTRATIEKNFYHVQLGLAIKNPFM
jgi:hypothetical protein